MPDWKLLTPRRKDRLQRKEGRPLDALPMLCIGCSTGNSTPAMKNCRRGRVFYCSSLVTSCSMLLAWAKAEMPVWLRISYFDMLEVAEA